MLEKQNKNMNKNIPEAPPEKPEIANKPVSKFLFEGLYNDV